MINQGCDLVSGATNGQGGIGSKFVKFLTRVTLTFDLQPSKSILHLLNIIRLEAPYELSLQ